MIPPGTGKVNTAIFHAFFTGEAAIPENKTVLLFQCVGRCCHITDIAYIVQ